MNSRGSKSLMSQSKSSMDHSSTSLFENRGLAGEKNQVSELNFDILARLREKLEETEYKDDDMQKLIEKLPQ